MVERATPIHVLYVDDDPEFADVAATFLERHGDRLSVETAADASEGWRRLDADTIDCIVSDYEMPGTDGIEFLREIRETYPDLPFVLFTGEGSESVAGEAISAGATDYLQKSPGTSQYELLANRIENAVSQYRTERRAVETERQLRELSEATDSVLWMFDGDWSELLFINSAYEDIWGRSTEALAEDPRDFLKGVHPDDRDLVRAEMERLSNGETVDADFRVNGDEGYGRWVSVRGHPIPDDDGGVARIAGFARDITERIEREREVEHERDRFSAIFEAIPDSIVHVRFEEGQSVVRNVNSAFTETFGYDRAAIEGRPLNEAIVPEDLREQARDLDAAVQSNGLVEREVERIAADGRRTFLFRSNQVELPDGTVEALGAYTDITERTERERELARRSTAIQASIDGMSILDEEGQYTFVNQAHADVYGYDDPEALVGETWRICYDDAELERFEEEVMPTLFETGSWRGEAIGTRKDGTTFAQDLSLTVTDDGGIICVVRDVTDERERERELERYETVIEASGDPVYTLDRDGRFTYLNDALADLVGRDSETLLGEHASTLMEAEDVERGEALIRSLLSDDDRNTGTIEMDLLTADGDRIPCENHIGILPAGEDCAFQGTVGVLRDITDRVERERQLKAKNERLDRFVSVVSHDLRNPLEVATGRLDLVDRECNSEHIAHVDDALDRMEALIDSLLSLAREGERVNELEPVTLAETVEGCWRHVGTADATLAVETELTVDADPTRLKQLIENLLRNAVEHGGTSVTVTVGDVDDGTGFYVADDGPGIPDHRRDRVFQSGHSTTDDGIGFGLSIVQEIATAHGWDVTVTAAEDGGARFEITGVRSTVSA